MKDNIAKFVAIVVWLVIDMSWILFATKIKFPYHKPLQGIQGGGANKIAGGVVAYAAMIVSWLFLVVDREEEDTMEMSLKGMILGWSLYSVFNGSNYFMFNQWGKMVSVIDTTWGTFATTMVTLLYATIRD
jgi:uncharacterized membrane protein